MADAYEDQIADAVAAELNHAARSWHDLFTQENCIAVATRKPWYEAAELDELQCGVVPLTIKRERAARSHRKFDYGIAIDLQKMVEPEDSDQLRALSTAAEAIHDWFDDGHELTGLAGWICLEAERLDVYSLPQLYAERTWETLISLSVRGYRA